MRRENWQNLFIAVCLMFVALCSGCSVSPSASITGPTTGKVGEEITLTGSTYSSNYGWSLKSKPAGSQVSIGTIFTYAASLQFTPDIAGDYTFSLSAEDSNRWKTGYASDTHTVTVAEKFPPTVNAGVDGQVSGLSTIPLAGTVVNPDGVALTYAWRVESDSCGGLTLENAATLTPFAELPEAAELPCSFTAKLTVTSSFDPVSSSVTMEVVENSLPEVTVIPSSSLIATGEMAYVEYSATDPDGDELTVSRTLTAPDGTIEREEDWDISADGEEILLSEAGTYTVTLRAEDPFGAVEASAEIVATEFPVINTLTVDAGLDAAASTGTLITLSTTASDADGEELAYAWSFNQLPEGSAAELAGADTAEPSFTPDLAGSYVVLLTVTDPNGATATDTLTLSASDEVLLESLEIISVAPGDYCLYLPYAFQAYAHYSDGSSVEMTDDVEWQVTNLDGTAVAEWYVTVSNEPGFNTEVIGWEPGEYYLVATDPVTGMTAQFPLTLIMIY